MRPRRPLLLALPLAAALALAGCGSSTGSGAAPTTSASGSSATAGAVTVVASTNVYGAVAQAIGGDRVQVTSIIDDPSADPHSFEASPRNQAAIAQAKIVIANGGGYDDFVGTMVKAAGTNPQLLDVVELSGLEKSHPSDDGHAFNEHAFYSTEAMRALSTALVDDLSAADPSGAATFSANARTFTEGLAKIDQRTAAIKAAHPDVKAVVTEPVADYLVEAAGVENVTPQDFAEAVEQENDPSAKDMADVTAMLTGKQVGLLVFNEQTSGPVVDRLQQAAEQAGVPVLPVTETLPAGTTDYLTWINGTLDTLEKELG